MHMLVMTIEPPVPAKPEEEAAPELEGAIGGIKA
jgi:hypothetical protein